jgi:RAD54-like protein 2
MSDRIVDERNPDSHISSKDISSLICGDEDDPPEDAAVAASDAGASDAVMAAVLQRHALALTRPPFAHESLLVDRREKRLSKVGEEQQQPSSTVTMGIK